MKNDPFHALLEPFYRFFFDLAEKNLYIYVENLYIYMENLYNYMESLYIYMENLYRKVFSAGAETFWGI